MGRVTTDTAVGQLHASKATAEIRPPALRDGVAKENHGLLILLHIRSPLAA